MSKPRKQKAKRGFAAMSLEQRREIARKGGIAVSTDCGHMATIGSKGGTETHRRYKFVARARKSRKETV